MITLPIIVVVMIKIMISSSWPYFSPSSTVIRAHLGRSIWKASVKANRSGRRCQLFLCLRCSKIAGRKPRSLRVLFGKNLAKVAAKYKYYFWNMILRMIFLKKLQKPGLWFQVLFKNLFTSLISSLLFATKCLFQKWQWFNQWINFWRFALQPFVTH